LEAARVEIYQTFQPRVGTQTVLVVEDAERLRTLAKRLSSATAKRHLDTFRERRVDVAI